MSLASRTASILSLLLLAPTSLRASTEAATLIRVYDDGETKVISPSADVSTVFNNDRMKLGVGVASDILTSASSDVRTYSTKGEINDNRKEFSANFETQVPDGSLGVGYIQSDERDYHSKIITASGTREFFQKNTVFGIGLSSGQDQIGNAANPTFNEPMSHQVYSLSLTQVLSRLSLIQFIYDFRVESGYIASPYRQAKILNGSTVTSRPENHPRTRNRNALAVKYNYFLQPWQLSMATTYRFYTDSWAVRSHTIEERFSREFGKWFSMALIFRYYYQTKANFYADYYPGDPGSFYTGNTTLASYDSKLVGLRPQVNFSDHFSLYAKYEIYLQSFKNASDAGQLLTVSDDKKLTTNAKVIGLGLTAKF